MAHRRPDIWPLPQLPATPDLGCLVRHVHDFQSDGDFPFWGIGSSDSDVGAAHQAYFRVKCGKAAFHERVKVWMHDFDGQVFSGVNPDVVLGGDFPPYPSDWQHLPPQAGPRPYWFRGEYRNPAEAAWHPDAANGHSYDVYDNGSLSTIAWDDTGGDLDFDDFVIEFALVNRQAYFDGLSADPVATEAEFERFMRDDFPKLTRGRGTP